MAPRTRSKARVEASASRFEDLDDDLQNMIVWATTEGGAAKPAAALRGVAAGEQAARRPEGRQTARYY